MGLAAEELFVPDSFAASSAGRTIAIADEDRVVVERPMETAWTAKASLDPENLRKGLTRKARVPLAPSSRSQRRDVQKDRSLGRRIVKAQKVAVIVKAKEETMALKEKVCRCGCNESYTPTSNVQKYKLGHKPVLAKAAGGGLTKKPKPATKPKASALQVLPVAADAVEMVSVRVPASALDKLILLLPAKMKAAAIEKLLGELA
jgi:hypothetical protein